MQRRGQMIWIKQGCLNEYRRLHATLSLEVLERIARCKLRNYSIFHKRGYSSRISNTLARTSRQVS